jgi:hypothetical protein
MLALGSSSKLEKQTYHKVQQNYLIITEVEHNMNYYQARSLMMNISI